MQISLFILLFFSSLINANGQETCSFVTKKKENKKRGLTIDKAVEKALCNRPSIMALGQEVYASRQKEKSALSRYLPQICSTTDIYNGGDAIKKSTPIYGNVHGEQLIFSFSSPIDAYKIRRQATTAIIYNKQGEEDSVRFEAEQSFILTYLVQQKKQLVESLYHSAYHTLEEQKARREVELTNNEEYLIALSQYKEAQKIVMQYQDEYKDAFGRLREILGMQEEIDKQPLSYTPGVSCMFPIQHYFEKAYEYKKIFKVKDAQIKEKKLSATFARRGYLPSISTFVDYNFTGGLQNREQPPSYAGMRVSWNVFDGFGRYFDAQAEEARMLQVTFEKEELEYSVRSRITEIYYSLSKKSKEVQAEKIAFVKSKYAFYTKREEYQVSKISYAELANARFTWENARYALLSKEVECSLLYRQLLFEAGYPVA